LTNVELAAARYRAAGRFAHGFAKGKMSGDPAYATVVERLPHRGTLLDVGCGEGYLLALARVARPGLALVGVDHDERRLALARRALADEPAVELLVGDLRDHDLPQADMITCLDVLHYMPPEQQDAVLARLAATLAPWGLLLLRDGQADGGLRSTLLRWSETIAVAVGRHHGDGVFFRPARALRGALEALGLEVEVAPCRDGTPFANLLFVARKPQENTAP
jgi:2-polyprenyl-3-methyl-5-hydroxy-6-metoxy-1,4-benzoquinol methylase